MSDHRPESRVTVEDLLRLKRAERPSAEFWVQFESEFRAKQLKLALDKKPWWLALPRGLSRAFLPVPLGAAAALAITFVAVRHYEQPAIEPLAPVADAVNPVAPVAPAIADEDYFATSVATYEINADETAQPDLEMIAASEHEDSASSSAMAQAERPRASGPSPSARIIAANLAAASKEPELAHFQELLPLAPRSAAFEVKEPMASVSAPRDQKLNRLYGSSQLVNHLQEGPRPSGLVERMARRLSEDEFYDSARRWNAKMDRVDWKL